MNTTLAPLLKVPVCADTVSVVVVALINNSCELPDPISRPVAGLAAEKTGYGADANAVANVTTKSAPTPAPEPNVNETCMLASVPAIEIAKSPAEPAPEPAATVGVPVPMKWVATISPLASVATIEFAAPLIVGWYCCAVGPVFSIPASRVFAVTAVAAGSAFVNAEKISGQKRGQNYLLSLLAVASFFGRPRGRIAKVELSLCQARRENSSDPFFWFVFLVGYRLFEYQ
ncbi:MAG TPA: hypothetical protein VHY91_03915 [Pirellulales bacterium]|nr:hypothetical protein [Pirellulales bacterium]